jgi:polyhydroxyalkanoate synthesis regulator phasin
MAKKRETPTIKETIKKGVLAGLGAIDFSIEKAKAAVEKLVDHGELSADQGRKLLDEFIERGRKDSADLSRKFDENIRKGLDHVSFVSRSSFHALEARVAALEARLDELASRRQ